MDREKVIKGLECCCEHIKGMNCDHCPFDEEQTEIGQINQCTSALAYDALNLLKEQEAKNGYWINPTSQDCYCSECGEQPVHEPGESVPLYDFCPYCGAKMEVKWNE